MNTKIICQKYENKFTPSPSEAFETHTIFIVCDKFIIGKTFYPTIRVEESKGKMQINTQSYYYFHGNVFK